MLVNCADPNTPPELRAAAQALCAKLVTTATNACNEEAFKHEEIVNHKDKSASKASDIHYRYGDMAAAGYGGGKVGGGKRDKAENKPGRKFYKQTFNQEIGNLAHHMCVLAKEAEAHGPGVVVPEGGDLVHKLFGQKFGDILLNPDYDDTERLADQGQAACFVTVNFSHDRYYEQEENIKDVYHDDPQDQSSTILLLQQHPDTPEKHRAHWYDEGTGKFIPIAGGLLLVFNGRVHCHGLIPPEVISMEREHAWYGSTVLVKHVLKKDKKKKVYRQSAQGPPRRKKSRRRK